RYRLSSSALIESRLGGSLIVPGLGMGLEPGLRLGSRRVRSVGCGRVSGKGSFGEPVGGTGLRRPKIMPTGSTGQLLRGGAGGRVPSSLGNVVGVPPPVGTGMALRVGNPTPLVLASCSRASLSV